MTTGPSSSTARYMLKENEYIHPHKNLCMNVLRSIACCLLRPSAGPSVHELANGQAKRSVIGVINSNEQ